MPDETSADKAMQKSAARFRAFVNASTDIVYRMSADWSEMHQLDGRGFVVDTAASRAGWLDEYIHPDDQGHVRAAVQNAIRTRSVFELEHRVKRIDGSVGWTLSRAVPLFDDDGQIIEWFGAAIDVTARREAVENLARVTAESERQKRFYESLISSTVDLVYAFDRNYRFIFANRALLAMWGRTLEDSIGKSLLEIGYEPWHAQMHEREIDQVISTKEPIRGEVGFPHATRGWRIYDYIFTPVLDAAGEVESVAGTTRDITEIKRTEEHLQLLINELNHRVRNTLATIQSIAAQTFRGDAATPESKNAFESRLIALSEAHAVLTKTNWEGANLRDIVLRALSPFRGEADAEERISTVGADIQLRPQVALALAMALHELASNAVKYGALSVSAGLVDISWYDDDRRLRLTWRESGGPAVKPPQRRGFGSRLIEKGLARELGGDVNLDFQLTGVVCTIDFPLTEKGAKLEP